MQPTIEVMDPRSPTDVLGYEWGQSGTKVTALDGTVAIIQQALLQGQNLTYAVPLVNDPVTEIQELPPTNFDQPNGAKWIDVNKTTYLATAYEGTTQVNQFIVSIGMGGNYETTDGTYYIYLKYDHQVMRGGTGTVEGHYAYATPVTWVSYFDLYQAFHEADWNTWQGTWQRRVSHGCVNMRNDDAKWIFDWAPIGTKVVVHY
jgi:lipoprotein-anchoring transpeptidase ErfK/SrfK